MNDVNAIAAGLQAAFELPEGALKVQRATRLWVEVEKGRFQQVFDHLVKTEGFTILCTITGLDLGADLGFIYHLARDGGIMANLKTRCPKGESFPSVTPTFPGSAIYEAELVDLLGAKIDGLPPQPRYPLPEDWPSDEHPLLKDWQPKTAASPTPSPTTGGTAT
jgi:Ni,Fe-hydrogenase III component G